MLGAAVEGEKSGPIIAAGKSRYFFLKAPLRGEGCDGALLTCEVPVELMTPNRSNKLVEDSAGRLRPTAAARMNGNSLLSKLDKRCGQEAGCSGAPARRRPGGRDAAARENARKSRKSAIFSTGLKK